MNVVIFTEHSLVMEQTVNPIEQGVFEEVEKHKLRAEFRPVARSDEGSSGFNVTYQLGNSSPV
jgi:hypothetical protein